MTNVINLITAVTFSRFRCGLFNVKTPIQDNNDDFQVQLEIQEVGSCMTGFSAKQKSRKIIDCKNKSMSTFVRRKRTVFPHEHKSPKSFIVSFSQFTSCMESILLGKKVYSSFSKSFGFFLVV